MLNRSPSLAFRASIIFTAVFATIIVSVLLSSIAVSWADRGPDNLSGAVIALHYASDELREADGAIALRNDGRFANLAARNSTSWLIVIRGDRAFTQGRLPPAALRTVAGFRSAVEPVVVQVPGQSLPIGAAALKQLALPSGRVLIAAGGIDPNTLSATETMRLLLQPKVPFVILLIALVSVLAMLVAVPFFTRALAPIAQEAASIGPHDPTHRLQEQAAPKELLPLVKAFNSALDRLQLELGRRKRLISDVSHELRTPIAVVSLQVDRLPEGRDKADIQRGLWRLTHLISQMLDLERLSLSSQQGPPVDLVQIARAVVAELAPMAINRGYDLSVEAPDQSAVRVFGHEEAIGRAVTNLVGNSIAHGTGTGQIVVTVTSDRTIEVSDEGAGIPSEVLSRLFEPFVRWNPQGGGSGLGLHLTRQIMLGHGGDILFIRTPRGAKFRLTFPEVSSNNAPAKSRNAPQFAPDRHCQLD